MRRGPKFGSDEQGEEEESRVKEKAGKGLESLRGQT